MTPAAQLANFVRQKFVQSAVPDLAILCRDLGLRISEVPAKGFDGALTRSEGHQKGIILVNANTKERSRKRFTIAHEIGHFIIPHHRKRGNVCEDRKVDSFDRSLGQAEIEANEFAAELLLPTTVLRERFALNDISFAQLSAIAAEFETSLTATTRSFLTLTNLPCAMIWSVKGQARWCFRSDTFRFFLPVADLPANGSLAAGIFNGRDAPSDFTSVRPDAWFDRQAAERVETLLEHSLSLPNYNAVLTLLWAYKVVEAQENTTEEESLLDEIDPGEFGLHRRKWRR